jgi:hypothetical protein
MIDETCLNVELPEQSQEAENEAENNNKLSMMSPDRDINTMLIDETPITQHYSSHRPMVPIPTQVYPPQSV